MGPCGCPQDQGTLEPVREVPPTESFIVTHFNEVVSLIIAAAMGWAGKTLYATIQEQKALKKAVKALLHN